MKKRLIRMAILLCIGLGIGNAILYYQSQQELESGVVAISSNTAKIGRSTDLTDTVQSDDTDATVQNTGIGGDFELINQDGSTVTNADYADQYKLVFFGFSFCPAVCPTELQKISLIMEELGPEISPKITPIFISVDPERDTPEVLKAYVAQFHPKLVGLTGSSEQIEAVKQTFRVYSSKVENEMMEGYMVDHSSFLYFMTPENNLISLFPSKDTAEKIAADVKAAVK
tara:strand:- start:252 stop:935 length:684 start_codon:yes stop_codon:yes gene_type:complete